MGRTQLSKEEALRYSRNILLDGIGADGQMRLLGASVLIVGSGALGSVVAMYLAGSGIGRIGVADFDTVDISNLQRQLSFTMSDVGHPKAGALAGRIRMMNPDIEVVPHNGFIDRDNVAGLISGYDYIVEGSDNPDTKYMVTDICGSHRKPYVLGGVAQMRGQVMSCTPGSTTYREIFPEGAAPGGYMPCSIGGVLGPLPGIIGSVMAAEIIKMVVGTGQPLYDRLFTIDASSMSTAVFSLK